MSKTNEFTVKVQTNNELTEEIVDLYGEDVLEDLTP